MQRPEPKPSRMVAYGARCTWWDEKSEVGSLPSGLPCCPVCRGVLFEADADDFLGKLDDPQYEEFGGMEQYPAFVRWLRGKCYPDHRTAHALFLHHQRTSVRSERVFDGDRDDEPGLTPRPGKLPPQLVEVQVESAAMRSRSRGWLPAVVFRIATDDGAGLVGTIEVGDRLVEIHESIAVAMERAVEDVRAARKRGR